MNGNKDLCEERGAGICNESRQKRLGEVGVSDIKSIKDQKVDFFTKGTALRVHVHCYRY